MPGAWELRQMQSVLVGILHVDQTTIAWSFGLRNLQIPGTVMGASGMPYDHGRNEIVKAALHHGFQHVMMLDSDVIPPNDAILRLLARNEPIISGVYCRRSPPAGVPVMMKGKEWVTQYPANAVIDVDLVGAGCLLVHRSVFERLPPQRPGKPWFDWRVDLKDTGLYPPNECLSEDFSFCRHAKTHGFSIKVDTAVQCRHIGYAQATYGSLVPLECTPIT